MNYFYEKSKFSTFKSNVLYSDILKMNDAEFEEWARLLRREVVEQWDAFGIPPVIGKNESGIKASLSKLRKNKCDFLMEDPMDPESLGIIKNFNKDASPINQFFPTMMKTKISAGKSSDGGLSIYDHFASPSLEKLFINIMRRAVKKDSMYSWSRSVLTFKDDNPFWNGQTPIEFVRDVSEGKVFVDDYSHLDMVISKLKFQSSSNFGEMNDAYKGVTTLRLTYTELMECIEKGYLKPEALTNLGKIEEGLVMKNGNKYDYVYYIRWYDTTERVFPKLLQVIRLSCGQPAVNFPALTARWIYETYTSHIQNNGPINIYDSSSGWGGRIIGAMSSEKPFHYIGTDPNPDNYIPELGITRYEYVADFFNTNCIGTPGIGISKFFNIDIRKNTYEIFREGSELIHDHPEFQKYKGKLDIAFTSPPYFNREQYSQDPTQSFKAYPMYDDWRDNFLKPTLTTIYEWLKRDRYILWNIANIKIGKNEYFTLEEDSRKILEDLGCVYKGKLKMLMTRMVGLDPTSEGILNSVKVGGKHFKYEPIFVFYKP